MTRLGTIIILLLLCLPILAGGAPKAISPPRPAAEFRAFWVDGFNDGFQTPAQCDQLLARVRDAHLNAIIVEMRKRADADYASHYEPWATDDPQHFDALAYLCRQAHAPGLPYIQVHAWVNACSVGGNPGAQSLVKLHPDWLSLSDTGSDYDGESTKIDLGNPAAAEWTYRVYLDLVRHYDIDGIHFDAIRYGGTGKTLGHWGYNAVSVARYHARYGTTGQPAWNDPRWAQWRRDQVTDFVRRVSVASHALKPHLIVSAATICWGDGPADEAAYEAKSAAYTQVFADWRDWLKHGLLDLNCPMTYFDESREPKDWQDWADFVKNHQYHRLSTLGVGSWMNTISGSLTQIRAARQQTGEGKKAAGVTLFSYAGSDTTEGKRRQYDPIFYNHLARMFGSDVSVPAMPWLQKPQTGALMGWLLTGEALASVDGSLVRLMDSRGKVWQAESDGSGFFAFPQLPPGRYFGSAFGPSHQEGFRVRIIRGHTQSIVRLQNIPSILRTSDSVQGVGRLPTGTLLLLPHALVTVGSDRLGDDFYIANGFGQPAIRVQAPGLSPPTIKGDRVVVTGTLFHTQAGALIGAIAVRQVGAILVQPSRRGRRNVR